MMKSRAIGPSDTEIVLTRAGHISYGIAPRTDGVLAQLVEHHNGIVGVKGSNPLGSTILHTGLRLCVF